MCGLLHEKHIAVKWDKMRQCTPTDGARERSKCGKKERLIFGGREQIKKESWCRKCKIIYTHNDDIYIYIYALQMYDCSCISKVDRRGTVSYDINSCFKGLPGSFIAIVDIILQILPF